MGRDALISPEEQAEYRRSLEQVDWTLPGMEKFDQRTLDSFKRSIEQGDIVNSIHSLGWALWPTVNRGYYDSDHLRQIADFLEIQNKPFWDEYDRYCEEQEREHPRAGDEDAFQAIDDNLSFPKTG